MQLSYLGKYGISFDGMEQGFKLGDMLGPGRNKDIATLKIEAFDLKTDPCLPKPINRALYMGELRKNTTSTGTIAKKTWILWQK